jgi:hypothetical protein
MVAPTYPPDSRGQTCRSQIPVRQTVRLRRSSVGRPGLRRVRRGKGFSYYDPDGELLTDDDTVRRITELAIPPSWRKVWIATRKRAFPGGGHRRGRPPAKSGVQRNWTIDDPDVVRVIRSSRRRSPNGRLAAYENGTTVGAAARRAGKQKNEDRAQAILEKATAAMIRRVAKGR